MEMEQDARRPSPEDGSVGVGRGTAQARSLIDDRLNNNAGNFASWDQRTAVAGDGRWPDNNAPQQTFMIGGVEYFSSNMDIAGDW